VKQCIEDNNKDESTWLVLDGPADSLWIENLNTVLDDNKTLCLSNGQRIKLPQSFQLVFEVLSLENTTTATVSRCGMVYLDNQQLNWESLIPNWIHRFKKFIFSLENYTPLSENLN
jgi:dynein heavy chain, axonemal